MKFPLEETIGDGYRFLFTNIISVIGTAWLPYLLAGAIIAGMVLAAAPAELFHGNLDFTDSDRLRAFQILAAFYPLMVFIQILAGSMVTVGLMERALGKRTGVTLAYLSFGSTVWRMVGGWFLTWLLSVLNFAFVIVICIAIIASAKAAALPAAAYVVLTAVVVIAGICAAVYVPVRLFYFLPAVVVAEERVSLARAWNLGGGNFWRIVLVALVILLPIGIIGGMISNVIALALGGNAFMPIPDGKGMLPSMTVIRDVFIALWPAFVVNWAFQAIAGAGVWYGALGHAYLAVTGESSGDAPGTRA